MASALYRDVFRSYHYVAAQILSSLGLFSPSPLKRCGEDYGGTWSPRLGPGPASAIRPWVKGDQPRKVIPLSHPGKAGYWHVAWIGRAASDVPGYRRGKYMLCRNRSIEAKVVFLAWSFLHSLPGICLLRGLCPGRKKSKNMPRLAALGCG